ncbi:MAG: hypothetical protein KatS3mg096_428 [Candidatus Parcubacteria bacterium]|nr:MAG: hypothetical protein KatS3mg096_428 [Candidatus Parcubacteria bacterium]
MNKEFSCVIPAYNEEGRIGNVVRVAKRHPLIKEVIVVSDGSIDRTVEEARLNGADKVIELKKNIGKGGAVFIGSNLAKSDWILLLDGDLIGIEQKHIDLLLEPILSDRADMTIGVLIDEPLIKIFPVISGQRVVKRELIIKHPELKESRFQLELLLNKYAKQLDYRIINVNLPNLSHVKKEQKYNFLTVLSQRLYSSSGYLLYFFKKIKTLIK